MGTTLDFAQIKYIFPEGIADSELRNVWVYLENPYGIDICLVLGENSADWSDPFTGHRLTAV